MKYTIIKMGGSLLGCAREIVQRLCAVDDHAFLIIPGGGPMADLVRGQYLRHKLSQETAHWMAILAMEQYGYFLADGTGAVLTREVQRHDEGVRVLLPYLTLLRDDSEIGHSWEYTSDSVAALVASRLESDFVKATDVNGIVVGGDVVREVWALDLRGHSSCLDEGTPGILISSGRRCMIMDGSRPDKFVSSLLAGDWGTVVKG